MNILTSFDGFNFFSDILIDAGYRVLEKNPMNKGANTNQAGNYQNDGSSGRDSNNKGGKGKINSSGVGGRSSKGNLSDHGQR